MEYNPNRVFEIAICKIQGSPYYKKEFLVTGYVKDDDKSFASLVDITNKTGGEIVDVINNPTAPDLTVEVDVLMDNNSFVITGGVRV